MFEPFGMEHVTVCAVTPTMFQTELRILSEAVVPVIPPPMRLLDYLTFCDQPCSMDGTPTLENLSKNFDAVKVIHTND